MAQLKTGAASVLAIFGRSSKSATAGRAIELVQTGGAPAAVVPRYSRPAVNRSRVLMRKLLFFFAVIVPSVVSVLYCLYVATPLYTSEVRFFVGGAAEAGGASAMAKIIPTGLSGGGSSSLLDGFAVRDYLNSYNALQELDEKVGFFKRYQNGDYEPFFNIARGATREQFLSFYQSMVKPRYNMSEGIVSIEVFAPMPDDALLITRELRSMTERFSNDMNRKALRGSIDFAQEEVSAAQQRLVEASIALDKWRKANSDIDPESNATQMGEMLASLQMKYVEASATFDEISSATKNSPQKKFLQNKLDALSQQIEGQRRLISSQQEKGSIINKIADYQSLKMQAEFTAKGYETALSALQGVRATAGFKQKYVLTIVEPTLAETPEYPRPAVTTLIVFCLSLVAYGFLSLLLSVIMESRSL